MGKRAKIAPAHQATIAKRSKLAKLGAESSSSLAETAAIGPGPHCAPAPLAIASAAAADGAVAMAAIAPAQEMPEDVLENGLLRFRQHCDVLLDAIPGEQSILGWFPSAVENAETYLRCIRQKVRNLTGLPGAPCYMPIQMLGLVHSPSRSSSHVSVQVNVPLELPGSLPQADFAILKLCRSGGPVESQIHGWFRQGLLLLPGLLACSSLASLRKGARRGPG